MVTNGGNPLGRLGSEDSEDVEDVNGLRHVEFLLHNFNLRATSYSVEVLSRVTLFK